MESKKASMLQSHLLKLLMLINGPSSELYLRVTMSSGYGQNHSSSIACHHFYATYGINEEISNHYIDKLVQDLQPIAKEE